MGKKWQKLLGDGDDGKLCRGNEYGMYVFISPL